MDTKAHQAELAACKRNLQLALAEAKSNKYASSMPPVQRLDNLTKEEVRALERIIAEFDEFDGYSPDISYDFRTLTGIIEYWPTSVRQRLFEEFRMAVERSLRKLPPNVKMSCRSSFCSIIENFKGQYKGSCNQSAQMWTYTNQDRKEKLTAVVEVEFTAQSYAQLVEDARMWLEGNAQVQTFFLVKVEEDPEYTEPSISDLSEKEIRNLLSIDAVETSMAVPTNANSPFGPIQISGLVWVGKMKLFLEVWKGGDAGARRRGPRYVSYAIFVSYCAAFYADSICLW